MICGEGESTATSDYEASTRAALHTAPQLFGEGDRILLDEVTQVDACVKVKGLNKERRSVQEFEVSRFPLQSGKLQATLGNMF